MGVGAILGTLALAALATAGCQNTAEGLKRDAGENALRVYRATRENGGPSAQQAKGAAEASGARAAEAGRQVVDKLGAASKGLVQKASEAGKNLAAAATLTPAIKTALSSDNVLRSPENHIDVDTSQTQVTLHGQVSDPKAKARAGQVAAKVLKDRNATQTVVNELQVNAHQNPKANQ